MMASCKLLMALALVAGLVIGPSALAQTATSPVASKLEARKIVVKDGKETSEPGAAAQPGDVIEYVATYTNQTKGAISKLEPTLPIPVSTELIEGSFKPAGARASLDGVAFAPVPLTRKIKLADGKEVDQTVPLREYRYLRWNVGELGGEKSVAVSARVRLLQNASINAPPAK